MKVHLASVYEKILSSMKVNLSGSKVNLSASNVNLSSSKVNLSSSKVNLSRGLILKSIVCCVCVMFSSDVSWGMNEEKINNNLNKGNDEIEINVEKVPESLAEQVEATYKVVLLGNAEVGKTQILNVATKGSFDEQYTATVGVNFYALYCKYTIKNDENPKNIKLHILDTSGQKSDETSVESCLKNADVVVFVYDITNKTSFNDLNKWLETANENAPKDAVCFLVGNKTDLKTLKAAKKHVQKFANDNNNTYFFEVSAKNENIINELFKKIAKACIKKFSSKKLKDNLLQNNDKKLENGSASENKRCSCCPCYKDKKKDIKKDIKTPQLICVDFKYPQITTDVT